MASRGEEILGALRAFNRLGADGFLDYLAERDRLAPEFAMTIQRDAPNGGVWEGKDGFRKMSEVWLEAWEVFELNPDQPIEIEPDRFVIPTRQRAVVKGTDMELEELFFYTVRYADDRWAEIGLFNEREKAERFLTEGEA